MKRPQAIALLSLVLSLPVLAQMQQDSSGNNCLYLSGSSVCPQFQTYIGTSGLESDYPFFSDVTDVASFDKAVEEYFSSTYITDVLKDTLGCTKATDSVVVQWQRTVYCSTWAYAASSQTCVSYLQGSGQVSSIPRICGSTCAEYATSMTTLGKNTTYCPSNSGRSSIIQQQQSACYDVSSSSETKCVSGEKNEPGTCGFGSTAGACAFCATSAGSSASCCSSIDCSSATSSSSDTSSASETSATSTGSTGKGNSNSGHKSKGISGGAIAGIVIGVIAGLVILGLLVWFFMRRRRSQNTHNEAHLLNTPSEKMRGSSPSPSGAHDADNDVFAPSPPRKTEGAGAAAAAGAAGAAGAAAGAAAHKSRNNDSSIPTPIHQSHTTDGNVPTPIPFGAPSKPPTSPKRSNFNTTSTPDPWSRPGPSTSSHSGARTAGMAAAGAAAGMAGVGAAKSMSSRTPAAESSASDPFATPAAVTSPSPPAPLLAAAPTKIVPGAAAVAIHPYAAQLDDELTLEPGMKIGVQETFDDGWATGTVLSGGPAGQHGKLGKFPMVCVSGA